MGTTFSINIGSLIESTSYPLHKTTLFYDLLDRLYDNQDRIISPRDVRDTILSIWTSIPFKETISDVPFIGLDDRLNPTQSTDTYKVYMGKRDFLGVDIMNQTLLESDVDHFFYNTKPDTVDNDTTRLRFLAGMPHLHYISPFIQTSVVQLMNASETYSMDFYSSGKVKLKSSGDGHVILNSVLFPKISISSASASNSKTLVFRGDNELHWEELTMPNTNTVGTSSEPLDIYGTDVYVNGGNLELVDDRYTPISVGGIPMGTTFSNDSITEVLRRIIYPYLSPLCTVTTDKLFQEIGSSPNIILNYTISKRTNSTQPANLVNMMPSSVGEITTPGYSILSGTASGVVENGGIMTSNPITFTIMVTDGYTPYVSDSVTVNGVLPYFYGILNANLNNSNLGLLTKLIDGQGDKDLYIQGMGTLYFLYDNTYPLLSDIIDENNNSILSQFTMSVVTLTSPNSYWINRQFKMYRKTLLVPIGPPNARYKLIY